MERHAKRLNFSLPFNFRKSIFTEIEQLNFSEVPVVKEDLASISYQNRYYKQWKNFSLVPRLNQPWPHVLKAITVSAPNWDDDVRGTKHGDWKPYLDARAMAIENNADISLLIENELIDGDRCMPIMLDSDGVAYYPRVEEGALDSITLEQIKDCLEKSGIPVRPAIITMRMILRAEEMIVVVVGWEYSRWV